MTFDPVNGRKALHRWFEKVRPDAILSQGARQLRPLLSEASIDIPGDLGLATLNRQPEDAGLSGIDQCPETLGARVIDALGSLIHRREFGIPENPLTIQVRGTWVEGTTVRPPERS